MLIKSREPQAGKGVCLGWDGAGLATVCLVVGYTKGYKMHTEGPGTPAVCLDRLSLPTLRP